jgi:pilus assembly protein CpaB
MDKKPYIALAVAGVLGVLAVLMTSVYLDRQRKVIFKGTTPVKVVVAKTEIKPGTPLGQNMIDLFEVPEKFVRAGTLAPKDLELVMGQKVSNPLRRGDPILFTDLGQTGKPGERLRLQDIVRPGERALSMPVDERSGVSGLIRPGDHVDILGTFTDPVKKERVTVTVLQNVTVLGVGGQLSGEYKGGRDSKYSTLTLDVSQEEAEILVFALGHGGSLTYLLRHHTDVETARQTPRVSLETILKTEVRNDLQKKRNDRIQVIRGGKS